jgi:hypothetical protein
VELQFDAEITRTAGKNLTTPSKAPAQSLEEATALKQQTIQLYKQRRFSEAIPPARRALTILEKALGPDHQEVAESLNNLAELIEPKVATPMPSRCTSVHWR